MSGVPGTFVSRPPAPVRDRTIDALLVERALVRAGNLSAERWRVGDCSVIVAREPMAGEYRWHLSIAHASRYPTWDEVKTAAYGIATVAGATLAQVLGPVGPGEWVDHHRFCLHLYELHDPVLESS